MDTDTSTRISNDTVTRTPLDRVSHLRPDEDRIHGRLSHPETRFVPVWGQKNLFSHGQSPRALFLPYHQAEMLIDSAESLTYLGDERETAYFAVGLRAENHRAVQAVKDSGRFRNLKAMMGGMDPFEASTLAYARAMTYWHHRHRYCGACGSPTESVQAGHLRTCTQTHCRTQHFPRTDPAVIVIVSRGDTCLLARQAEWPERVYSTLAGFVEPGESLEETVVREVEEESGVRVSRVRYHSSQPWPFPCSIMLGFTASADHDRIRLVDKELEDARWFTRERIYEESISGKLLLPPRFSISYRLIEHWFDSSGQRSLASFAKTAWG